MNDTNTSRFWMLSVMRTLPLVDAVHGYDVRIEKAEP